MTFVRCRGAFRGAERMWSRVVGSKARPRRSKGRARYRGRAPHTDMSTEFFSWAPKASRATAVDWRSPRAGGAQLHASHIATQHQGSRAAGGRVRAVRAAVIAVASLVAGVPHRGFSSPRRQWFRLFRPRLLGPAGRHSAVALLLSCARRCVGRRSASVRCRCTSKPPGGGAPGLQASCRRACCG